MRSASRNPRVTASSSGSPVRSSSALVATVVPIFTTSTRSGPIGSSRPRPSIRRMPSTAASSYCPGFSESSFAVASVPSGRRPTTSVKVPTRSIQNCQRLMASSQRSGRTRGLVVQPRERAQHACQMRQLLAPVGRRGSRRTLSGGSAQPFRDRGDQAALAHLTVVFDKGRALGRRRVEYLLADLLAAHQAQPGELVHRVGAHVRVLVVEREADVVELLAFVAVMHMV